ncbi:DUF397 domain-containing protein [Streptomyces sp. NBC_00140]|uniref:DUF397 domain-containing protein n=1 Tax=Streptomyces sp. NBC_00140 TaxID=2975664 RepID=UPI00225690CD|nr:DUF397 domain-containing protein [Streptomyces sp. NBC_00140]MCX5336811.1 DUF397 domain-containing protein [Streptomyces sp. NBC_00140]
MQPVTPNWRTSTYTGSETCVEVANNEPALVRVRDTKARDRRALAIQPAAWSTFVEFAKNS